MKIALLLVSTLITAACATAPQPDQPMEIIITNDAYLIDGQLITPDDLSEALSATDRVLLKAEKNVSYDRVVFVMNECAKATVTNLLFLAQE